jgi:hypothetical protein
MTRAYEAARSASTTKAVLEALQTGPKFNTELSKLSPTVSDHITFLRQGGYHIECQRVLKGDTNSGKFVYRLMDMPPPDWDIVVEVNLADGTQLTQQMRVGAFTARQAKGKARNLAAKTRVLTATLLGAVTGHEFDTEDEGH